ncbi:sulfite oxidase [Anaerobacillus sp. CMMVII]|uniref:sulfite oxidase n=1 Tax=Anaerobacillus sp. CMMVII TaxID=2755588 RepID=UPI0021B7AEA8|nr:sulfite oxidase [Anaerobacillus sp. CMMVII]MCT8138773.1 sulfite oxidase [Anaerobacillus sp. CMMVII]
MAHENQNKPFLTTRSLTPENQETPIEFLRSELIPSKYFFRRNHFLYPKLVTQNFILPITGKVINPFTFYYQHLLNMTPTTITGLLECAGNKRSKFEPKVFGEQWEEGAISQGQWRGVALRDLLAITGLLDTAKEVLFEGYDYGTHEGTEKNVRYARSLPIEKALHLDTIIAYEYNGRPLTYKHGFPLRLFVPGWYGMASVKWLKKITVIDYHFKGPFQANDYVYYPKDNSPSFPVTTVNVNSIIQNPLDLAILTTGNHTIEGLAWSGEGIITKVEISFDGQNWVDTLLTKRHEENYTWSQWHFHWNATEGEHTILCRATDSKGRSQPTEPMWNKKGYGYNAISKARVKVK